MLGTLRRRGEEQRGRGRHAEGRSVVLRQVVTEKAGGVRRLQELQPLLIKLMQGRFAPINPIEQSKGHLRHGVFPPSLRTAARRSSSRLLKKAFSCFDRLSTNGKSPTTSSLPPFALSLSKGERRVFQHPARGAENMRYGVSTPNFGDYSDPRLLAELAREAEAAGWDGFFLWDHIVWPWHDTVADPWVALAVMAMSTERLRLGPMGTPIPRRHPWKLARETVTLDRLSAGRLLLGVGLGGFQSEEVEAFGEEGDPKVRAAKLDEGLEVLTGLWSREA